MAQKLTPEQRELLCNRYNWSQCIYDNNGVLVRSLVDDPDATDWQPVADDQIKAATGVEKMTNWAQNIIDELREKNLDDCDDATRGFIAAFDGEKDEMVALDKLEATAKEVHDTYEFYPHGNHYYFYLFADGSVYCDAKEGIDRFFPSLSDLADADPDFAAWLAERDKNA